MSARYIVADVFDGLASLPEDSVDLVMSSPPFLALRSYLPPDHPRKAQEIGSEATPAEFIDGILDVVEACDRVLAPHGSLVFELGDTYAGSGGGGGDYLSGGLRDGQPGFGGSAARQRDGNAAHWRAKNQERAAWPLDKSKVLIPEAFALSLAYGRNILRSERTTEPWRVRNLVAWCRPNPPVGALGDKYRPATSYLTVATKALDRYFDLDAVRTPSDYKRRPAARATPPGSRPKGCLDISNPAGAPPLDYWVVPTHPYKGSHYATYPPELCRIPILSMCPERVCTVCGEPSRRELLPIGLDAYRNSDRPQTQRAVELADEAHLTDAHIAAVRAFGTSDAGKAQTINNGNGKNTEHVKRLAAEAKSVLGGYFREFVMSTNAERGSTWTDCGHNAYRTGVVLDPFAGTGTTLAVATGCGRDAIGIDIDERNAELALERVGGFLLTVETLAEQPCPA